MLSHIAQDSTLLSLTGHFSFPCVADPSLKSAKHLRLTVQPSTTLDLFASDSQSIALYKTDSAQTA